MSAKYLRHAVVVRSLDPESQIKGSCLLMKASLPFDSSAPSISSRPGQVDAFVVNTASRNRCRRCKVMDVVSIAHGHFLFSLGAMHDCADDVGWPRS